MTPISLLNFHLQKLKSPKKIIKIFLIIPKIVTKYNQKLFKFEEPSISQSDELQHEKFKKDPNLVI